MRGVLLRFVMLVVVVAMVGGHVTELFDHWDHTMRSGTDSDYLVVIIAASIGVGLVGIKRVAAIVLSSFSHRPSVPQIAADFRSLMSESSVAGPSPPLLLPIRI